MFKAISILLSILLLPGCFWWDTYTPSKEKEYKKDFNRGNKFEDRGDGDLEDHFNSEL